MGRNQEMKYMLHKIKTKLMYSFAGVVIGGAAVFAVLQVPAVIFTRSVLSPGDILKVFILVGLILAVILGLCSVSLIRHEGFRPTNLVGPALGLFWAAGNVICLWLGQVLKGAGPLGRFVEIFGCYMDLCLAGMFLMAFVAAKHKPVYDKDYVIIPGCSISKQGGLLPLLKGRTNRAIRFAWDQEIATGKPVYYIPTGGQGPDEIMSEGSAMEFYLLSHGAEQYEVFPEKKSVNTYENMLFSKRIIDAHKKDAKVCYVTTNYHVLRSGMLARRVGLDAEGLASSTKWYFWPNGLARELVAIHSMYRLQSLAAAVICLAAAWIF